MSAEYLNLYIEQGSDFYQSIVLNRKYNPTTNIAFGNTYSSMKYSYYAANTTASFNTSIDFPNNSIILTLPAAISANIEPGKYVYDAIVSDSANNTTVRLLEGVVEVAPGVTNITQC